MKTAVHTENLIIGAGVSGLALASRLKAGSYLILEKEREAGGYCRTFYAGEFVWDYAGHFFHFSQQQLRRRFAPFLQSGDNVYNHKRTLIFYRGRYVDYPFQFNICQLDKEEFIDCLCGLFEGRGGEAPANFKEMLYAKFGVPIAEKFLIPYNEKLYSCDLNELDIDAMGRFFPKAEPAEIIRHFRGEKIGTYNDTFFYSAKGAAAFVEELLKEVDAGSLRLGRQVERILPDRQVAVAGDLEVHYRRLISTMPFPRLLSMCGLPHRASYTSNKVLIFNLGFDAPPEDRTVHWIYYPDPDLVFYRVGFYNNILHRDKMSLYVEIGLPEDARVRPEDWFDRVLCDLKKAGLVTAHKLLAWNCVLMDPAYVHISAESQREKEQLKARLAQEHIHTIGRYGDWKYCSIEDCVAQAYQLGERLAAGSARKEAIT